MITCRSVKKLVKLSGEKGTVMEAMNTLKQDIFPSSPDRGDGSRQYNMEAPPGGARKSFSSSPSITNTLHCNHIWRCQPKLQFIFHLIGLNFSRVKILTILKTFAHSIHVVPVDHGSPYFKAVEKLMNQSWKSEHVGKGRDAKHLAHKNIKVKSVCRIENLSVYLDYANSRKKLISQATRKSFPAIRVCIII